MCVKKVGMGKTIEQAQVKVFLQRREDSIEYFAIAPHTAPPNIAHKNQRHCINNCRDTNSPARTIHQRGARR